MTPLSTGAAMKHRMTVQRNTASPDPWGTDGPPTWADHLTALPCRAWTEAGRGPRVGGEKIHDNTIVVLEGRRVAVAVGTDVTERDRVLQITLANGTVFLDGPMDIRAVETYSDHLELVLHLSR